MKKILVLVIAAYFGLIIIGLYKKNQCNEKWNDEKWHYFREVVQGNNLNEIHVGNIHRWKHDINVKIQGNPTSDDFKTIRNTFFQINKLITPLKIQISNDNPNFWLFIQNPDSEINLDPWQKNAFAKYDLTVTEEQEPFTMIYEWPNFTREAKFYIKSNNINQRQILIKKGFAQIILGLKKNSYFIKKPQSTQYLNYSGNNLDSPIQSKQFKTSIFNSSNIDYSEFTDIDKYIISTCYSENLKNILFKNSLHDYLNYIRIYEKFSEIIFLCLIMIMYFSGYFERTLFLFIERIVNSKFFAFNIKTFSIVLIAEILFLTIEGVKIKYLYSGIAFDQKINFGHPNIPSFSFFVILTSFVLLLTDGIYFIEKVLYPKLHQFIKQQVFSYIFLVSSLLILLYITYHKPIEQFYISSSSIILPVLGLGLVRFFYNYSKHIKSIAILEKEQEITTLKELKTRAELISLQSKINPHFLYNALNSIAGYAYVSPDKVEQMALALSKLFRYSINKDDDIYTTLKNEIEMVSIYLEIEKIRFGDKLQYKMHIDQSIESVNIPKFIIQPLIENAIKHGTSKIIKIGILNLDITKTDIGIKIKVSDNGPDFPEDLMTGYGLQNVYDKLDILYPNRYEIVITNGIEKNITVVLKNDKTINN